MRTHQFPLAEIEPEENFEPVVARRNSYVPARPYADISMSEQGILSTAISGSAQIMAHRQMTHHARSNDSAITNALASLIYSVAMGSAAAMITAGILFIAYNLLGGEEGLYAIAWLVTWGICVLMALLRNRLQGLWHSSTGIAHHEIESRERIALYAIDRHVQLIEKRWGFHEPTAANPLPANRIIQGQSRSHAAQEDA